MSEHESDSGPVLVAVDFTADSEEEVAVVRNFCEAEGIAVALCSGWANGGAGAADLAEAVVATVDAATPGFTPLYDWSDPIETKVEKVARKAYGADGVIWGG